MKNIDMNDAPESNEVYKEKCMLLERLVKVMTTVNVALKDRAYAMDQELMSVFCELLSLQQKVEELDAVVKPSQLYFTGKSEEKFYRDRKEKANKKKTKKRRLQ